MIILNTNETLHKRMCKIVGRDIKIYKISRKEGDTREHNGFTERYIFQRDMHVDVY